MEEEIWKDIPGYEGYYQVSNLGRVKSLSRLIQCKNGKQYVIPERRLTLTPGVNGYIDVCLRRNVKGRKMYVHQLVLITFVGSCPDGMECRHYPDRDPTNNRLDNLQWGTVKQNAADRKEQGGCPFGEIKVRAKLKEQDVIRMRRLHELGISLSHLSKMFGVNPCTAWRAVKGITWKGADCTDT